jgi:hypothetical protein
MKRRIFFYFLKIHILHYSRRYLGALFLISVYSCLKCYPSPLDINGNRVLRRNFRKPSLFTDTWRNYLSARCGSAANHVCKDVDFFGKIMLLLKTISAIGYNIFISIIYVFSGLGLLSYYFLNCFSCFSILFCLVLLCCYVLFVSLCCLYKRNLHCYACTLIN